MEQTKFDAITHELQAIVGDENVLTSLEERYCYSRDATWYQAMPDVVVRPHTTEEIVEIVKLANRDRIPITPRGAGTCLTGGAVPIKGGIVLDMTRMNKILEISRTDLRCVAEPGVVHADLENELAKHHLFWPPDPASSDACTIGGVLAEGAGGLRALKYGTARDWVLGLEVVLPTGEVIRTGASTLKWSSGYDLTRLFVRSEGTLGIITKAVLKVRPIPEALLRMSVAFDNLETAGLAVGRIFEAGMMPTILEFIDLNMIRAVNDWLKLGLPETEVIMIIDFDGTREEVEKLGEKARRLLMDVGAKDVRRASTEKEMADLYLARKSAYPSLFRLGKTVMPDDTCVPISKLPEALKAIKRIGEKWGVFVGVLGHWGDGNIHPVFSVDMRDKREVERAVKCYEEIMRMVLNVGGTIGAEHGVGLVKAHLLEEECGGRVLEIMRGIKKIFDPNGIMNPGKMNLG